MLLPILFCCNFPTALAENSPEAEDLKHPVVLQDLAYGNILFDYYRGEPIKALTSILIAQEKGLLPHHSQSARLLSGVIYLDLGMLVHAQEIFNSLLSESDLQTGLFSKIEFYLGKLHYRQGDFSEAEFRLSRIVTTLDTDLRDEGLIMLSNIALSTNDKDKAKQWLTMISKDSKLASVSRYNLGILWLREGGLDNAIAQLSNIHPEYTEDVIIKSLQDKAMVALGYYHLSHKKYNEARSFLSKVRLKSPFSNKALLGMGWSYAEESNYNRALSHWLELSKRDIRDVAVQEVLLAIPYAYQNLNSMQSSLTNYDIASETFQQQINLIDELLSQIQNDYLIEKFVKTIVDNDAELIRDGSIEDSTLFGEKYDYYLFELVSQHQFNEGFRNYQKLGKLSKILEHWEAQLPTFSDILIANKIRFDEKIPLVDKYLVEGSFDQYQNTLTAMESDLTAVKSNQDLHLLANSKELEIYNRINSLMNKISHIPSEMLDKGQVQKAVFAKGILDWKFESEKAGKIWQLEKSVNQIRDVFSEMQIRKTNLFNARDSALGRFVGYQEKVDSATSNLFALQDKIKLQINFQAGDLKEQIVNVLLQRRQSLDVYLLQSDLSIARLHEKAVKIPEID